MQLKSEKTAHRSREPLCQIDDIPDGGAKGVVVGEGPDAIDIILLRRGSDVFAYLNSCPHNGTPLETFPDKFLDQDGETLICSTHGARFRVKDGFCIQGPCKGASLEGISIKVTDGEISITI